MQAGRQLILDYACYSCHGYNATGRTPLDRRKPAASSAAKRCFSATCACAPTRTP